MAQLYLNQKPTVIVNPVSGRGKTFRNWDKLKNFLLRRFREIRERFTEAPKHAIEIAREEIKRGVEHIITVGGDGTLNEVINGFFENFKPINPKARVSILPSGRGNDFAKTLELRPKRLTFSKSIEVDLVKMGDRFFVNVMDMGLGGEIVSKLNSENNSGIAYTMFLFREFFKYKPREYVIYVDGEKIEGKFLTVVVANGTTFGGGMKIAPEASPSDGILDVVAIGEFSPVEFIFNVWRLYTGRLLTHPKVIYRKGRKIRIETHAHYGEFDGELFKASTLKLEVVKGGVEFLL